MIKFMKDKNRGGDTFPGFARTKDVPSLLIAGKENKTEEFLRGLSLSQSRRMSMDLDFFGLTEEVARPIAHSLSTNKRGGGQGWLG